jgi:hypothetical protein
MKKIERRTIDGKEASNSGAMTFIEQFKTEFISGALF